MRFPEDLVELPAVQTKTKPSAQEMRLAQQLIEGMAEPWIPSKYTDDYVKALDFVFTREDETFVDGLVVTGHAAAPGYNDPAYPIEGRRARTA